MSTISLADIMAEKFFPLTAMRGRIMYPISKGRKAKVTLRFCSHHKTIGESHAIKLCQRMILNYEGDERNAVNHHTSQNKKNRS